MTLLECWSSHCFQNNSLSGATLSSSLNLVEDTVDSSAICSVYPAPDEGIDGWTMQIDNRCEQSV